MCVYSERVYGIPPEQAVGTAAGTKFGYDEDGKLFLTKEPKLLLNDNNAGKPEGTHLKIGRRPRAAFGNPTATGKCRNMSTPAMVRVGWCWCCTTTRNANTPPVRRGDCPTASRQLPAGALRRSGEERPDRDRHEE